MIDKTEIFDFYSQSNTIDKRFISFLIGELTVQSCSIDEDMFDFKKLDRLIDIASGNEDHSLLTGSLGVMWLIRDLCAKGFLEKEGIEDFAEDVDNVFESDIDTYFDFKNYDLFDGLIGKGLYFLKTRNYKVVKKIIRYLDSIKIEKDEFYLWLDNRQGENICDFGLAHGIPSIISFLSKCHNAGLLQKTCKKMIAKSLPFLLLQFDKLGFQLFPHSLRLNDLGQIPKTEQTISRLAWCYGNFSLAISLWWAGVALDNIVWKEKSIDIMLQASKVSIENSGVFYSEKYKIYDIGFCHGTSGIAYIFQKFYLVTKKKVFSESANYWFQQTLLQMKSKKYLFPLDLKNDIWETGCYSLLEGISGVLMVILSFENPEKRLDWDDFFFTNIDII